jgi:hypothetical protein
VYRTKARLPGGLPFEMVCCCSRFPCKPHSNHLKCKCLCEGHE